MSDAERFDAFYAEARDRVLVQAFALTGDLPASRGAVRDAFIAAWHHWAKVRRLEDPEGWVRPHAWSHAQRRHTARIWHRDRSLDPGVRATLDALARLPVSSRRALLLTQLTTTSREEMAREVGLPLAEAERRL
jgi:DNA-directed RNA polymerase specialized sigma24 family protein